jgi:hypothetical protein
MVLTQPAGTEPPDVLDDAIREVKTVLANVVNKALSSTGFIRCAKWYLSFGQLGTTGAATAWQRLPLTTIVDPLSILTVGAWTNSIKPIAGSYLVKFGVTGCGVDKFMGRFATATGNSTAPSASSLIADAYTTVGDSPVGSVPGIQVEGSTLFTTDGTISYCLDEIYATANGVNGFGKSPGGGGGWPAASILAFCDFIKVG